MRVARATGTLVSKPNPNPTLKFSGTFWSVNLNKVNTKPMANGDGVGGNAKPSSTENADARHGAHCR